MITVTTDPHTRKGIVWYLNVSGDCSPLPDDLGDVGWWGHGPAAAENILASLEQLIERRRRRLASAHIRMGNTALTPLTVVIDNCHELWDGISKDLLARWEDVAAKARSASVRLDARTPHADRLSCYGGSAALRDIVWDHTAYLERKRAS